MATETEFWGRPEKRYVIDTAGGEKRLHCRHGLILHGDSCVHCERGDYPAVSVTPVAERLKEQSAARARIVRDALRALSDEPMCGKMFALLAKWATDAALDKLGRMLR